MYMFWHKVDEWRWEGERERGWHGVGGEGENGITCVNDVFAIQLPFCIRSSTPPHTFQVANKQT